MTNPPNAPSNPLAGPHVWNLISADYTSDLLPFFEHFSRVALDLAELPKNPYIADVACGPGTLSLLAAADPAIRARVEALDVSPDMLERFRARVAAEKAEGIRIVEGDGMNLPWENDAFDGAFSMFGLIFFPDRGAGFRELRRVLKPGARAVVSSWAPRTGPFALVLESIAALLPDYPFGKGKAPLGDPEDMAGEMRDAGFRDVRVERVEHAEHFPSLEAFWTRTQRTAAPLRLLREKLGEARWVELSAGIRTRLADAVGEGPLASPGLANLGVGVK
jgi:SAM-dependent methyltransferase